jgi:DNA-binding NtrC family response regulator
LDNANIPTESPEGCHILVVDDEAGIVNAVRRELSAGGANYAIETFTNPVEALERARTQKFHAVLADYRMPEMDGVAFLKALYALQPDCARIVLSGQTDMDALVRMINETHIFRFIAKPWNGDFLRSSLAQALAFRAANIENRRLQQDRRKSGMAAPAGAPRATERVLVVDEDVASAREVARCLSQHSRLDDLYAAMVMEFDSARVDQSLNDIDVQITDSPRLALDMAERTKFSCVVADCRMAAMDGVAFFARLAERQPDCQIVLVSAVPNIRDVAFEIANLSSFLVKPWNDFELRTAVAQALAQRRLYLENRALAQAG